MRIRHDGSTELVDRQVLQVGDQLQVNEGDRVSADSFLLSGELLVDESMITGESIPVEKQMGDPLTGGTLVKDGNGRVQVTAVGKQSVLAQIIQLVEQAQRDKPDIQRLADRISAIFVPNSDSHCLICGCFGVLGVGFTPLSRGNEWNCGISHFLPLCYGAGNSDCGYGGGGKGWREMAF